MGGSAKPPPRSVAITHVTEWDNGTIRLMQDSLAAEEPLEIRIDGHPLTVTMRTPGHDVELAAGFLLTEGIIAAGNQIGSIRMADPTPGAKSNVVEVRLTECSFDPAEIQRNFFSASSCGICGTASIESIRRRVLQTPNLDFRVAPESLCRMADAIREKQAVFARTGGLHAAALFSQDGELVLIREDIGRHNAVDKVVGWALQQGRIPLDKSVLLVSGRGGFEIAQKSIAAGVPVLASVSAPSSLAVKLAREMGLTLIGFLRGRRFVIYSGESRCMLAR